ncbi:MAG TPA: HAMP domain-containing histidine kinase [Desulfobulbus sp.]|nr:HAMP domain-containing histidine kinase [Desulfobulbus sp.]
MIDSGATGTTGSPLPSWLMNLLGFGLLIALVLVYFFYQMQGINESLRQNVLEHSRMVAAIIEENLANAELALTTVDRMVATFLGDKTEFIAYLDGIDPLQPEELTALARETGLLGITLVRPDNSRISGPENWFPEPFTCNDGAGSIRYRGNEILFLRNFKNKGALSCILTGLDGSAIAKLRKKSSLEALLASLSSLPGIHSVQRLTDPETGPASSVQLTIEQGRAVARSSFSTPSGTIVVSLNAHRFLKRRDRLRQQFFFFAGLLFILGVFFSWLLYRFQQNNLNQVRTFEKALAREHEAAVLGRTTATIAHEIRNPLNAINMGLQRLRLESANLDRDQEELISAMSEAVKRTSGIVSELQRYTRPLEPADDTVHLDRQLKEILALYGPQIKEQHIDLRIEAPESVILQGDRDLINELLENLIKNAVEAQPDGGYIRVQLTKEEKMVLLRMENSGFLLDHDQSGRIGEPYFTTKTRGTGLGLALSRRIARAHDGDMEIFPNHEQQTLTVLVRIPEKTGK